MGKMWERIDLNKNTRAKSVMPHGGGRLKRLASRRAFLKQQERVGIRDTAPRFKALTTSLAVFLVAFFVALIANSAFGAPSTTNAADNEDTSSTTAGDYNLSVSATANVDLDISVSDNDTMTVSQGYVSVITNSPGYRLYISMMGDTTSLASGDIAASTIAATSGTIADPEVLTRGTWGYAIPSGTAHLVSNKFNSSYTVVDSATPSESAKFAMPPRASVNPALLATSDAATSASGDSYPVFYGVRLNSATNPGAYSNNIAFTAVADAGTTESMTLTPSTIDPDTATTITVATTMYSTATNLDATITLGDTALTCTKSSSTPLTYSCEVPATTAGNYTVTLSSPRYGKTYSATLEVVKPVPTSLFDLTTMQELADYPTFCADATTPNADATEEDIDGSNHGDKNYVPTVTLLDDRTDGTANTKYSYRIRKLADGKCWMTQNLRLKNATLTSSDSNLTTISSYRLKASSTSGWCTSTDSSCINTENVLDSGNADYGVYYSWASAIAGTPTAYSISTQGALAPNSICPKGWHLPSSYISNSDFQTLYNQYNSADKMRSYGDYATLKGPAFVLSGYRNGSTTDSQGTNGYYWSSTARNASRAYYLYLYSSSVDPAYGGSKYNGFSVRCVAE